MLVHRCPTDALAQHDLICKLPSVLYQQLSICHFHHKALVCSWKCLYWNECTILPLAGTTGAHYQEQCEKKVNIICNWEVWKLFMQRSWCLLQEYFLHLSEKQKGGVASKPHNLVVSDSVNWRPRFHIESFSKVGKKNLHVWVWKSIKNSIFGSETEMLTLRPYFKYCFLFQTYLES